MLKNRLQKMRIQQKYEHAQKLETAQKRVNMIYFVDRLFKKLAETYPIKSPFDSKKRHDQRLIWADVFIDHQNKTGQKIDIKNGLRMIIFNKSQQQATEKKAGGSADLLINERHLPSVFEFIELCEVNQHSPAASQSYFNFQNNIGAKTLFDRTTQQRCGYEVKRSTPHFAKSLYMRTYSDIANAKGAKNRPLTNARNDPVLHALALATRAETNNTNKQGLENIKGLVSTA